jgi:hypothetical protein
MKGRLGLVVGVVLLVACSGSTNDNGEKVTGSGGSAGSGGSGVVAGTSTAAGTAGSTPSMAGTASTAGSGGGGAGTGGVPADLGSGACHDFTVCGGDLLGSWLVADTCWDPELAFQPLCPSAKTETVLTGTAEFRADGTMSSTLHVQVTTTVSASCAEEFGLCGEGGQGNGPVDCETTLAGDCVCSNATDEVPSDASYTTTPEGMITITRDGTPSYSYYCRAGDEVWVRSSDSKNGRITVMHMTKL